MKTPREEQLEEILRVICYRGSRGGIVNGFVEDTDLRERLDPPLAALLEELLPR